MKIIPQDDGYTFLVPSRTREGVHHVDLIENRFNGYCTCEDYTMRRHPIFRVTRKPKDDGENRTRCDHILACREWFTNDLLNRLRLNELRQHARSGKLPATSQDTGKISRADLSRAAQSSKQIERR